MMRRKWWRRAGWVASVLVLLYVLYGALLGGVTGQRLSSPGGRAVARTHWSGGAGATDANYVCVSLRTWYSPLWHCVFGGLDYGTELSISWLDSKHLLVRCGGCNKDPQFSLKLGPPLIRENQWRDVTVRYEFW
jgi:hypothetical protein